MGWGAGAGLRIVVALASALALAGCATPGSPGGEPVPGPTSTAPTSTAPPSTAPTSTAEPVLRRPLVPVSARELLEYCPAVDAEHFDVANLRKGKLQCFAYRSQCSESGRQHHGAPTQTLSPHGC